MAAPTFDGGRIALAGFLYQILGTTWFQAAAHIKHQPSNAEDVDALTRIVRDGSVKHEAIGDAQLARLGLDGDEEVVLIQFKFSGSRPPRPIHPNEFRGILQVMAREATEARTTGLSAVRFVLITNRHVSKGKNSDVPVATRSLWDKVGILALELDFFSHGLRRFAEEFGCREDEIEAGTQRLIGDLMQRTLTGYCPVTLPQLVKAYTGSPSTRPYTGETLAEASEQSVRDFADGLRLPGPPVRRGIADELTERIERSNRALVVLHGPGGVGKSTSLYSWARERLAASTPKAGLLTALESADRAVATWMNAAVCDAAGLPSVGHHRRDEGPEDALDRLGRANPDCPRPLLIMGLDGVDEESSRPERRREFGTILKWFWEEDARARGEGRPPLASLVVTCREWTEVRDMIRANRSGFAGRDDVPEVLRLDRFSPAELMEAARAETPWAAGRFYATRDTPGEGAGWAGEGESLSDRDVGSSRPVHSEVFELLLSPVLWGSFLELRDEGLQRAALDNEPAAIRRLAREFTFWFCTKAKMRGSPLQPGQVLDVLHTIAAQCPEWDEAYDREEGWVGPACRTGLVNAAQAGDLFHEALTAGYIAQDGAGPGLRPESEPSPFKPARRWRWAYRMCIDLLGSSSPGD